MRAQFFKPVSANSHMAVFVERSARAERSVARMSGWRGHPAARHRSEIASPLPTEINGPSSE